MVRPRLRRRSFCRRRRVPDRLEMSKVTALGASVIAAAVGPPSVLPVADAFAPPLLSVVPSSYALPLVHNARSCGRIRSITDDPDRRRLVGGIADRSPSSSSSALSLSLDEAIYAAQSAASDLASSSGSLSGSLSLSSLGLLYVAGLLTSFSPCSLGLLPLTVSYISAAAGEGNSDDVAAAGGGEGNGRKKFGTVGPTLAFAGGLASVFCGLGLSAALLGNVFGSSSSGGVATLMLASLSGGVSIAMGLQLLELINLPLPSFELNVAEFDSSPANGEGESSSLLFDDDRNMLPPEPTQPASQGGGGSTSALVRTFLLGGSSALVASPCATPVLTSILAYVAASQDPAIGSALLLTYTIGYTTPLLIIGASGGSALAYARDAAERGEDTLLGKIGGLVTPLTAAVLIWYGTSGMLEAILGDPSLAGLAPILE